MENVIFKIILTKKVVYESLILCLLRFFYMRYAIDAFDRKRINAIERGILTMIWFKRSIEQSFFTVSFLKMLCFIFLIFDALPLWTCQSLPPYKNHPAWLTCQANVIDDSLEKERGREGSQDVLGRFWHLQILISTALYRIVQNILSLHKNLSDRLKNTKCVFSFSFSIVVVCRVT